MAPSTKPTVTIASILAFLAPAIATVSAAVTTWLFVHIHILGIFHVTQSKVATTIASAVVYAVTAGITYAAAHFHWLPIVLKYHE